MVGVKGLGRGCWRALAALLLLGAGLAAGCGDVSPVNVSSQIALDSPAVSGRVTLELPAVSLAERVEPVSPVEPVSKELARPNILLITVDTLRADAVGAYGNPRAKTPNMDSLAQDGTLFSLDMTVVPQTNPTHASILTGVFPSRHGIFHHMASMLSDSVKPLAEIMSEAGYTTTGHYSWISFDPQYSGLERGFATYERHTVDRSWPADRKPDFYEEYLDSKADVTTDGVLAWLERSGKDPFFMWIHYNDAHWPYEPPSPFDTMFDGCQSCMDGSIQSIIRVTEGYQATSVETAHLRGLYDGEVAFVDQQLGRLFGWLRDRGLLDRTVVVLTADHGEGFGEKGLWSHQEVMYNTALRVPLLIRYPGGVPKAVVGAPASAVDILPTLMDILGLPTPEGLHGKSLLPLMQGTEDGHDRAVFSQLWDARKVSVVYQGMKLIKDRDTGALQLYDLAQDLAENHDLTGARPEVARILEQRVDAWVKDQGLGP